MKFATFITKKRLSFAVGGVAMVGGLAALGLSPAMSNVSSTDPTSIVAPVALNRATTTVKGAGKGWLPWLMRGQEVTVARTSHSGKTITFSFDRGLVTGLSPTSITIAGPAGVSITESISQSTKFGKLSLQQMQTDFGAGIKLHARLIEKNNVLTRVVAFQSGPGSKGQGNSAPNSQPGIASKSGVTA